MGDTVVVDSVIVGLDLTTCTGWAVFGLGGHLVDSGAWDLGQPVDAHEGDRWVAFRGQLGKLMAAFSGRIRAIGYERPSTQQWAVARIAFGQAALIELEASRLTIPTTTIPPATLKKLVAGHGRATKQDVQNAVVQQTGPLRTRGSAKLRSDEADARGVAMAMLAIYDPDEIARGQLVRRLPVDPKPRRKKAK